MAQEFADFVGSLSGKAPNGTGQIYLQASPRGGIVDESRLDGTAEHLLEAHRLKAELDLVAYVQPCFAALVLHREELALDLFHHIGVAHNSEPTGKDRDFAPLPFPGTLPFAALVDAAMEDLPLHRELVRLEGARDMSQPGGAGAEDILRDEADRDQLAHGSITRTRPMPWVVFLPTPAKKANRAKVLTARRSSGDAPRSTRNRARPTNPTIWERPS